MAAVLVVRQLLHFLVKLFSTGSSLEESGWCVSRKETPE